MSVCSVVAQSAVQRISSAYSNLLTLINSFFDFSDLIPRWGFYMLQFAISEEQSCVEKVFGGGCCWLTLPKHIFLICIL